MSGRTLVTGFGPFGSVQQNPSAALAESCGSPFRVLEVAYEAVDEFISDVDPDSFDCLLMLGVAAGREHLSLELFARNWKSAAKDVRGIATAEVIDSEAPILLGSTLWRPEVAGEIVAKDPRFRLSMDAGEYLCNYSYYRALQRFPAKKVGFLHVPTVVQISLEEQSAALNEVLRTIERA